MLDLSPSFLPLAAKKDEQCDLARPDPFSAVAALAQALHGFVQGDGTKTRLRVVAAGGGKWRCLRCWGTGAAGAA